VEAKSAKLRISEKAAVPGQVILLSGKGLKPKRAKVTIGGKKAEIATRTRRSLGAVVPKLKPGNARVDVRSGGRRLRGRLRVGAGFSGKVKPRLDPLRASSAEIGPAGGVVTATGADGTVFALLVPEDALPSSTTITLTPVAQLSGLPGSGSRLPAVQFGPDGLVFARRATLMITPASRINTPVGLVYAGNGAGLSLVKARRQGSSLVLPVDHFSGAAATSMTFAQFDRLVARLSALPMSLAVAAELYSVLSAVRGSWCDDSPTCNALRSDADQLLGTLTLTECEDTAGRGAQVKGLVSALNLILALEADLQALGRRPRVVLTRCRETLTRAVLDLTKDTTQSDPLGVSGPCAGVVGADYDSDQAVRDLECGLYAGFVASMQGFPGLQNEANTAASTGLRKILDTGKAKCDQAFSHAEGLRDLKKGAAMAAPFELLTAEVGAALEYCVKITVTPSPASVEVGKELDFAATAKDPTDASFQWSTNRGAINAAGHLTAPTTPGPLTVTATSEQNPDHEGTASVTVSCPAGKADVGGVCQEVGITIDPTAATLQPGGTQQFTATVTGTADTRVDWATSCGSVTQAGLYTAPNGPGTCQVGAVSRAVPSKAAIAIVTVQETPVGTQLGQAAPPGAPCGSPQSFIVISSPTAISYRVPHPGVITSWSHHGGSAPVFPGEEGLISIKFKVARKLPPPTGTDYLIVGEDGPRTAVPDVLNTFSDGVRIPVQTGDVIGLTLLTHTGCVAAPFSGFDVRSPLGGDLSSQDVPAGSTATLAPGPATISALDVAANLEPDADADGFGDLTQDGCPSDGTTHGPCP